MSKNSLSRYKEGPFGSLSPLGKFVIFTVPLILVIMLISSNLQKTDSEEIAEVETEYRDQILALQATGADLSSRLSATTSTATQDPTGWVSGAYAPLFGGYAIEAEVLYLEWSALTPPDIYMDADAAYGEALVKFKESTAALYDSASSLDLETAIRLAEEAGVKIVGAMFEMQEAQKLFDESDF